MKQLYLLSLVWLVISCTSQESKESITASPTGMPALPPALSDTLFRLHNLPNSLLAPQFYTDYENTPMLFADSTKRISFPGLDSLQKRRLIVPVVDIESEYVTSYMNAFLISKQQKVGAYQPITVWVSGDDYSALLLIVLDEKNLPISHYVFVGFPVFEQD